MPRGGKRAGAGRKKSVGPPPMRCTVTLEQSEYDALDALIKKKGNKSNKLSEVIRYSITVTRLLHEGPEFLKSELGIGEKGKISFDQQSKEKVLKRLGSIVNCPDRLKLLTDLWEKKLSENEVALKQIDEKELLKRLDDVFKQMIQEVKVESQSVQKKQKENSSLGLF